MTTSSPNLELILSNRRALKRELLTRPNLQEIAIYILGGSTTNELADFLEILLLHAGFRPTIHQSEFGRFFETAVLEANSISELKPDIVYVHTSQKNIRQFPPIPCDEKEFQNRLESEIAPYKEIWSSLQNHVGCQIIQNNFELMAGPILGNLDTVAPSGASRFIMELNREFATYARTNPKLLIQDIFGMSAALGLNQWFDAERWFHYKIPTSPEGTFTIASSLTATARALYGKSRKVLVLDLDNTLWGGIIGDDGKDGIVIGRETPAAEAYTAFQEYCLALHNRGILLAACSKNDENTAKQGLTHPDSVLRLEHFSAFKANWEPKHENILAIAKELNLGLDSFVFVDDNPAERAIVEAQLPMVAVPDVGSDIASFRAVIDSHRYFETISVGEEDVNRGKLYQQNAERQALAQKFANYGEYLDSLEMKAEIDVFSPTYIDRIAQLTNKSNQFNLTTRRYTRAELESIAANPSYIGIYGKLSDRFGDNGLISVVLGSISETALNLDLWLMSCRVLKREMELAMLDAIVEHAKHNRLTRLVGHYLPTDKNSMVADHYEKLGFSLITKNPDNSTIWSLELHNYQPRTQHIKILEHVNG